MKTLLPILLTVCNLFAQSQQTFVFTPDANGDIIIGNFKGTYHPQKGDSIILTGPGIKRVKIDSVCLADCYKVPVAFRDTAAPVVVVPPVVQDDTIRITGAYTLTQDSAVVLFTGTQSAKLSLPQKPTDGFSFVVVNAGKANLAFNKQLNFLNGKYRLMIKPGETFRVEYRQPKKKYYITKRIF